MTIARQGFAEGIGIPYPQPSPMGSPEPLTRILVFRRPVFTKPEIAPRSARLDFAPRLVYQVAVGRCPKCGSGAWDEGAGCVTCGHQAVPRRDDGHRAQDPERWWDGSGGDPGLRRLELAWAERDAALDGEGEDQGVGPEAKVYTCKQCGEAVPTPQALAGHANTHRRQRNGRPGGARREAAQETPRPAARQRERPPAEAQEPEPVCPLCAQPVPAAVGVLAQQFQQEGAAEELALRLATLAWAGLRVA